MKLFLFIALAVCCTTRGTRTALVSEVLSVLGSRLTKALLESGYYVVGFDDQINDFTYHLKRERLQSITQQSNGKFSLVTSNSTIKSHLHASFDIAFFLSTITNNSSSLLLQLLKSQVERNEKIVVFTYKISAIEQVLVKYVKNVVHFNLIKQPSNLYIYGPLADIFSPPYLQIDEYLKDIDYYHPTREMQEIRLLYVDDAVSAMLGLLQLTSTASSTQHVAVLDLGRSASITNHRTLINLFKNSISFGQPDKAPLSSSVQPLSYVHDYDQTLLTAKIEQLGNNNGDRQFSVQSSSQVSLEQGLSRLLSWHHDFQSRRLPCIADSHYRILRHSVKTQSNASCLETGWDRAARLSREVTAGCSVVLYTFAVSDVANKLHGLGRQWNASYACAVAFVSSNSALAGLGGSGLGKAGWMRQWRFVAVADLDPFYSRRRAVRVVKMMPDKFFAASVVLAMPLDAKLFLKTSVEQLVALLRPLRSAGRASAIGSQTAMALFRNNYADLYDDAHKILQFRRKSVTSEPDMLRAQVSWYGLMQRQLGLCFSFTGFDSGLVIHRLGDEAATALRRAWFLEFMDWADRDQLPGGYVLARKVHAVLSRFSVSNGNQARRAVAETVRLFQGPMAESAQLDRLDCKEWLRDVSPSFLPVHVSATSGKLHLVHMLPEKFFWTTGSPLVGLKRLDWEKINAQNSSQSSLKPGDAKDIYSKKRGIRYKSRSKQG